MLTLCGVKNLHIIYSCLSVYLVHLHSWFCIGQLNHKSCYAIVFTIEKNLHVSGPKQFKPTLFILVEFIS